MFVPETPGCSLVCWRDHRLVPLSRELQRAAAACFACLHSFNKALGWSFWWGKPKGRRTSHKVCTVSLPERKNRKLVAGWDWSPGASVCAPLHPVGQMGHVKPRHPRPGSVTASPPPPRDRGAASPHLWQGPCLFALSQRDVWRGPAGLPRVLPGGMRQKAAPVSVWRRSRPWRRA